MIGIDGKYDVILADPAWPYEGSKTKMGAAAKFYDLMSVEEITNFTGITDALAPNGIAFIWATSPKLDLAMRCIEKWGLHYRGIAFVWVKTSKVTGLPIKAQGVRPSITKPLSEFVIAASRVPTGRPMKLHDESIVQTVLAPKREHSHKPDEVMERIELMYPDARRLEMFARRPRPEWDAWGDQVTWVEDEQGRVV